MDVSWVIEQKVGQWWKASQPQKLAIVYVDMDGGHSQGKL